MSNVVKPLVVVATLFDNVLVASKGTARNANSSRTLALSAVNVRAWIVPTFLFACHYSAVRLFAENVKDKLMSPFRSVHGVMKYIARSVANLLLAMGIAVQDFVVGVKELQCNAFVATRIFSFAVTVPTGRFLVMFVRKCNAPLAKTNGWLKFVKCAKTSIVRIVVATASAAVIVLLNDLQRERNVLHRSPDSFQSSLSIAASASGSFARRSQVLSHNLVRYYKDRGLVSIVLALKLDSGSSDL